MHNDHTHAELNLQQPQQRQQHAIPNLNRHVLHKMDHIFYNCIVKIKKKYFWWIAFHLIKTILVIGLIPINYYLLDGFKDVRVFLVFVLAALASLLQVIIKTIYRKAILNNNRLLLKIAAHLDHSSQQAIHADPHEIRNCVSLRQYNHQTHTIVFQGANQFNPMNQSREKQLIAMIKQQTHRRYMSIYVGKKVADVVGLLSMFYTLYVLMSGLGANALQILVMYMEFLVEFVAQILLIAIVLFILLLPLILVGLIVKCCYNNCKCEEGWWRFRPNEQKRLLPDQTKITQKMINQSDGLCTICLQEFKVNQEVIILKCSPKHIFHPQCIQTWIDYRRTCPNCRIPIKAN